MSEKVVIRYADLPTGNFFRLADRPDVNEFFKCQPWVSTTADLEKMIQFKDDTKVFVTNRSGKMHRCRDDD
jgi:hypothetical protein